MRRFLLLFALCSAAPLAGQAPVTMLRPRDSLRYARIPAGFYLMGCSEDTPDCDRDELPRRGLTISKPFLITTTEVTVRAWKRFARATKRAMPIDPQVKAGDPGWKDDLMPITNVSWVDASAFCTWAGGKLPNEAQWEYAARGRKSLAQYAPLATIAWTADNSGRKPLDSDSIFRGGGPRRVQLAVADNGGAPHHVAEKAANAYGLYDMLGNVAEWVQDWFASDTYAREPLIDPVGPIGGVVRTVRGGSWVDVAHWVRASKRTPMSPTAATAWLGFRCLVAATN